MKITNEFAVNTPIDRAWTVLTDLEGIAPCLPGAQLTGVEGETYSGKVKVKVGPVVSDFAGTARFVEKDSTARRAVIDAKGRDSRSAGNAAALVTAQLRADGERTLVSVDTDLKISGKLAQFGSGMIKEVSEKLLGQFVTNLEAKLAAEEGDPAAVASSSAAATGPNADAEPAEQQVLETASTGRTTPPADVAPTDDAPAAGSGPVASPGLNGTVTLPLSADTGPAAAPVSGPREWAAGDPHAVAETAAAGAGDAVRLRRPQPDAEPEPLDLLALAGGSVYKRAIPLGIGAVVVAAVIIWFVARR